MTISIRVRKTVARAHVDLIFASSRNILDATLPKKFFATLVECAAATLLRALEQRLHKLKPLHPFPELCDFSLGELMPAFRWTRPGRKPEEKLAYFLQGEPRLPGALHHSETEERTVIVAALTIPAHCRRENPDLLVVANG